MRCLIALLLLGLAGCAPAAHNSEIKCYSGGVVIYSGITDGRVSQYSGGFFFLDKETGREVIALGTCILVGLGGGK